MVYNLQNSSICGSVLVLPAVKESGDNFAFQRLVANMIHFLSETEAVLS
jgi:hypothetical protein